MDLEQIIGNNDFHLETSRQSTKNLNTLARDDQHFSFVKSEIEVLVMPNNHNCLYFYLSNCKANQKVVNNYSFTNNEEFVVAHRYDRISRNFEELIDF